MEDHVTLTYDEAKGLLGAIEGALDLLRERAPDRPLVHRLEVRRAWLAEQIAQSGDDDAAS